MTSLLPIYFPNGMTNALDVLPSATASQIYERLAAKYGLEAASIPLFQLWIETDEAFGHPFGGRPIKDSEAVLAVRICFCLYHDRH